MSGDEEIAAAVLAQRAAKLAAPMPGRWMSC
jgi:hypothetical protein